MYFLSDDKKFGVSISSATFDNIITECKKNYKHETGGILIGNYSDDGICAYISEATGPTVDSVKGKFSFIRGVFGLINLLNLKWDYENKYYIGEWHYHPNASSNPSYKDIKQMKLLAGNRKLKCPEPVLFIVGGSEINGWEFSVTVFTNTKYVKLSHVF